MGKFIAPLIGTLSLAMLGTAVAAAPNGSKEVSTALAHAEMAVAAKDLKTVDMHLHHVVNCIVGTKGQGFDASAGDPCKDMGDGALNDSTMDKALHTKLEDVLHEADRGLKDKSYGGAKKAAEAVADRLKAAEKSK
jgi:hypothetical protein